MMGHPHSSLVRSYIYNHQALSVSNFLALWQLIGVVLKSSNEYNEAFFIGNPIRKILSFVSSLWKRDTKHLGHIFNGSTALSANKKSGIHIVWRIDIVGNNIDFVSSHSVTVWGTSCAYFSICIRVFFAPVFVFVYFPFLLPVFVFAYFFTSFVFVYFSLLSPTSVLVWLPYLGLHPWETKLPPPVL